jgi:hypothetical protein
MYPGRTIRADGGEEVERLETVCNVVEFLAVACEEYCTRARTVADANDVALDEGGAVGCPGKGLIIAAVTSGGVCD